MMHKLYFWIAVFILFSKIALSNLIINEIMYNPLGSDAGREWIEIYNDGTNTVNISGWKFYEEGTNHGLTLINGSYILDGGSYVVIADDSSLFLLDYPDFNATLFDSTFSLSNTGEYLSIKNSSLAIMDFINYTTDLANGNGRSLERFNYGWNESGAIGGSPGQPNNASVSNQTSPVTGLKLTAYISDLAYVNTVYTSLFKIENLGHISGTTDCINLTIRYNITLNNTLLKNETVLIQCLNSYKTADTGLFSPILPGNYTIAGLIINSTVNDSNKTDDHASKTIQVIDTSTIKCNISLNISTDKEIYTEGEQVKFYNNLNDESFPFIIEYWIEDFFGNFYKNKYNSTNTNQKTWTTDIDEEDRVLFIKSRVYPNCNDTNLTDNLAEKMFIVKANETNSAESNNAYGKDSNLEIVDADEKAQFGDLLNIKIDAYRGDTSKYSISLYVEKGSKKASEITKFHLDDKYSSYDGQLPVQLKPNCDLKLENGDYHIILEGLDKEDEKTIEIQGIKTSLCQGSSATGSSIEKTQKFEYNIVDYPEKINPSDDFDIKIKLVNNDDTDSEIDVWSYVYRGSKCYSGERESNKQHLTLEKDSSQTISLANKVEGLESGDYKLKVMINKDSQKTNKEITQDIEVKSEVSLTTLKCPELTASTKPLNLAEYNIINQLLCTDSIHYKQAIYESKNEQIKKMIPSFIIGALTILSFILLLKRENF